MPGLGSGGAGTPDESLDGDPVADEELEEVAGTWPNLLTRLSTFLGRSSDSVDEPLRMDEARCGVGGGPRLAEPVDEAEGDLLTGEPDEGGGGKSPAAEPSGGGGGNSGDWGATPPPGCHLGLALTAGGDCGPPNLGPSVEPDAGREGWAAFPGN